MIGIHVEFEMQPGREDALLQWKIAEGELQRRTPGFIKRTMARDRDRPNIFYYTSYWRTEEQMLAFLHSAEFERVIQRTGVRDAIVRRTGARVTEVFDELGQFPND
ncbi:MAG: antibiotic biosynthesis monooxygenase [Dehalococcoidia bacterium]|nr:antibiotic biosynthesis monooxygenase [Dehalococcoidia bacterium]